MRQPVSNFHWPISDWFSSVIDYIFSVVEKHIEDGKLITEFNMSALPSLYDHFVKLIKYLVRLKFSLLIFEKFFLFFWIIMQST